jgi:hypothetical protein
MFLLGIRQSGRVVLPLIEYLTSFNVSREFHLMDYLHTDDYFDDQHPLLMFRRSQHLCVTPRAANFGNNSIS